MSGRPDILVIKLSALGDMILAFPAFERIRAAHPDARITLLTTPPYGELAAAAPWFNAVETDGRPASVAGGLALIQRLRRRRPTRVYDLQTNDRTNALFQALRPLPPRWSGTAFGCALPHANPARMAMHSLERHAEQLRMAGIWPDAPTAPGAAPPPDVNWLISRATIPPPEPNDRRPLVLLAPGASPSRPGKRWPAEAYGLLAAALLERGMAVSVIGGPAEFGVAAQIAAAAPGVTDLAGMTSFADIAALGARARLAVGNDTGPMHLIAAAGAPCLVVFSQESDPALCAPRGDVSVLRVTDLSSLPVMAVLAAAMAKFERTAR